jgi:hypothetical protein
VDPHQIERKDLDPDPHPRQSDKLDPDPDSHQFADDKPKCMESEPTVVEHFLKVWSLYLEPGIRIQIRIKVKGRIRIQIRIEVKGRIRIRI